MNIFKLLLYVAVYFLLYVPDFKYESYPGRIKSGHYKNKENLYRPAGLKLTQFMRIVAQGLERVR